jgi:hypothetical protein
MSSSCWQKNTKPNHRPEKGLSSGGFAFPEVRFKVSRRLGRADFLWITHSERFSLYMAGCLFAKKLFHPIQPTLRFGVVASVITLADFFELL